MPNWCENILTITGPKKDLENFSERAKGFGPFNSEKENLLDLHQFLPMPDEAIKDFSNIGYYWQRENWDCKWGACQTKLMETASSLIYGFESAWTPPTNAIKEISRQFPSLVFSLAFIEHGLGFCGEAEFQAGEGSEVELKYDRDLYLEDCGEFREVRL